MSEGKKYLLGLDVILSAGKEAITELQDSDDQVNEIYFDRKSIPSELRDDPGVRSFMDYAQIDSKKQNRERNSDGSYTINDVKVHLNKPDTLVDIIAMTDDPHHREDFYERGVQKVERPKFLLQNPKILKNGFIKPKVKVRNHELKDIIPMEQGIEMFEIYNPFFNQFVQITLPNQSQALYQLKQDVEAKGDGTYKHIGEPHFKRLLKHKTNFEGKHQFKDKSIWGISPNSINQYLALNNLLLDPTIELVVLSGAPGTGKTLMPYLAGLMQTLKENKNDQSLYQAMYLCRPLTRAGDEGVGYLPGDLDEKLGPLYENFSGIHEFLNLSYKYSFDDALKPGNEMKLKNEGLYLPNPKRPLIYMKNKEFMRGTNIPDGFIILDESQNFTRMDGKLLITRPAKGSKTVLCGDVGQIDNYPICTEDKNGLVFITQFHMKLGHPHMGVMHFDEPDRNIISNYSSKMPTYYRN